MGRSEQFFVKVIVVEHFLQLRVVAFQARVGVGERQGVGVKFEGAVVALGAACGDPEAGGAVQQCHCIEPYIVGLGAQCHKSLAVEDFVAEAMGGI